VRGSPDSGLPFTGGAFDSRLVHGGECFFALKDQRDGHDFVADAISRGARAAVVERVVAAAEDAVQVEVASPLRALRQVAESIRDDQPIVAGRVAAVGAGIQVRFGRVQPAEMAVALRSVLNDPAYRAAARRMGAAFALAGGAPTAADLLEKLT